MDTKLFTMVDNSSLASKTILENSSEVLIGRSGNFLMEYQSPFLGYSKEQRCVEVFLPFESSNTSAFLAIDNNINSFAATSGGVFFTASSVAEESNWSLTKKVNLLFPDLYEFTSERWQEPVTFRFISTLTGTMFKELKIWMEKDIIESGFSLWHFQSNCSTSMPIKDGAFHPNFKRKRSDINLLAPMFALRTAGFVVDLKSTDKDIVLSFAKYV